MIVFLALFLIPALVLSEEPVSKNAARAVELGRFIDMSNGTVLDKNTGLMWVQDANIATTPLPYGAARQFVAEMNAGKRPNFGYTDWRLPSINDLDNLIDKNKYYPALPEGNPFKNIQNKFYWSATVGMDVIENTWVMDLASGNKMSSYISDCTFFYFWPVRSNWMPAMVKSGKLFAYGLNDQGQLGDGTLSDRDDFVETKSMTDVMDVSVGMEHTVAIRTDGTMWAWGRNDFGQLGDDSTSDRNIPVAVKGLYNIIDISAGMYHTVALKSDGTVWAWGKNSYGQLGDGTKEDRRRPVQIKGMSNVVKVFAGMYSTFAITSSGTLYSWGGNSYGQLGDGTTVDRYAPAAIKGFTDVIEIAAGMYHTVALKSNGTVYAWGWNTPFGILGDGTKEDKRSPVQVKNLEDITDIAIGMYHAVAVKKDGTLWAWGKNDFSQLGVKAQKAMVPIQIEGISGVTKVAAGNYHSLAMTSEGSVYIWGQDKKGRSDKTSPTRAKDVSGVIGFAAGKHYTVVIKSEKIQ